MADSFLYDEFARNITSGKGYSFAAGNLTVYWPVGTSAIYAAIYHFFGFSFLPIVIFNILIGTAIVYLVYQISLRYLSERSSQLAALLVSVWPVLVEYTTILASELLFIFLVLSALYVWGRLQWKTIVRAILFGTFICAATYVRPTALPILLIVPLATYLCGNSTFKQCIQQTTVAVIVAAIMFSPWVYRNYAVFNQFVLVSANGGVNLWMGNNPQSDGGYMELPDVKVENEVARDRYFKQEAVAFIKSHPVAYVKLAFKRAVMTYKAETIGVVWNGDLEKHWSHSVIVLLKVVSSLYWGILLILGMTGIFYLWRCKKIRWFDPLTLVFIMFLLIPIATVGQDRYHLPVNPFLAIFAAFAISEFKHRPRAGQI